MKSRTVEAFEITFGHHRLLAATVEDAADAGVALARLAEVSSPANPEHPERTVEIAPVSPSIRRVFIPSSARREVACFGKRLPPAVGIKELTEGGGK